MAKRKRTSNDLQNTTQKPKIEQHESHQKTVRGGKGGDSDAPQKECEATPNIQMNGSLYFSQ